MEGVHQKLLKDFEKFEADLEVEQALEKVKQEWLLKDENFAAFAERLKELEPEKVEAQRRRAEQNMKFFAGFSDPFLDIQGPSSLGAFPLGAPSPPLGAGGHLFTHCRNPIDVVTFCHEPNLPTRVRVSIVPLLGRVLCLCLVSVPGPMY